MLPYLSPEPLSVEQIRAVDARAIHELGIPGAVLMENASRAVAETVYPMLRDPRRDDVLILCGPGNNGGDGLAAARHLHNAGVAVTCVLAVPASRLAGDAALNLRIYRHTDRPLIELADALGLDDVRQQAREASVIVDALLGTGSRGSPRGTVAELIRIANDATQARRVAVDIPSGLDAETGEPADPCFQADVTVTFVAPKRGFGAERAKRVLGRVVVAGIARN